VSAPAPVVVPAPAPVVVSVYCLVPYPMRRYDNFPIQTTIAADFLFARGRERNLFLLIKVKFLWFQAVFPDVVRHCNSLPHNFAAENNTNAI
jgi:hypothetical protein